MKISVIVPAYNIENYIDRCLKSLLNQTLDSIEIIVVNDGSTDNTQQIIENIMCNNRNRITLISQRNKGISTARENGLQIAKGEYILFVDGDDSLEKEALEKLYISAINNKSDIVLYNAFWEYYDKKEKRNTFSLNINRTSDLLQKLFLNKVMPTLCCKLIKLKYITENNIRFISNCSYAEDLAIASLLFMYNPKISFVKENLYNYYQRQNSITKTVNDKVLEVDKALKFIKQELLNNNLYDKYKYEYEYAVFKHLFEYQFLKYSRFDYIHEQLYKQFNNYNINIKDNKYIKNQINGYPLSLKIRVNSYFKNYKYGEFYDKLRKRIKAGYES